MLAHRLIVAPEARSAGADRRRPRPRGARAHARSRYDAARGRLALALGGAIYLAAWAFGSKALYPVALGLPLAVLLAWLVVRLGEPAVAAAAHAARGRARSRATTSRCGSRLERAARSCRAVAGRSRADRRLGERATRCGAARPRAYVLRRCRAAATRSRTAAPRSRTRSGSSGSSSRRARRGAARLPAARRARAALLRGGRALARTGAGCFCAGRPGSTCTACASTSRASRCARCTGARPPSAAQLMVKELEDSPRDEVAVVLDADPAAVGGRELRRRRSAPPARSCSRTSRRGRRAVLVVNRARPRAAARARREADWREALELLAAVRAGDGPPLAACSRTRAAPPRASLSSPS